MAFPAYPWSFPFIRGLNPSQFLSLMLHISLFQRVKLTNGHFNWFFSFVHNFCVWPTKNTRKGAKRGGHESIKNAAIQLKVFNETTNILIFIGKRGVANSHTPKWWEGPWCVGRENELNYIMKAKDAKVLLTLRRHTEEF